MKYCMHCGKEMIDEAVVCVNCGCSIAPVRAIGASAGDPTDKPSTGWAVLGFFFPLIGLILYLAEKDKTPLKAKSAGKGALIGVIASVVVSILVFVFVGIILPILMFQTYYY